MDPIISIWKESQCFGLPLVIQEVLGEVVAKLKQNRAEFCLGSMPALRRQTTEEQHYFALRRIESVFSDLSEKLRNLASRIKVHPKSCIVLRLQKIRPKLGGLSITFVSIHHFKTHLKFGFFKLCFKVLQVPEV